MFMKVCKSDGEVVELALTGFTRVFDVSVKNWKSRILQNRRAPSGGDIDLGVFYSPHRSETVQAAIRCWVGLLHGQSLSLSDGFAPLPLLHTALAGSEAHRITGWDLDLSDPAGIALIEKPTSIDSDGTPLLPNGVKIAVRRVPRATS